MSVLLLPLLAVAQAAAPVELKTRIVEASIFKSGLVMLTREVQIPAGEGSYRLDVTPEALDGTFWYRSQDALTIGDVETKLKITERAEKIKVATIYDLLLANSGRTVSLLLRAPASGVTETVTGELAAVAAPQYGSPLLVKLGTGSYRAVNVAEIIQIQSEGLVTEVERKVKVPDIDIRFKAKSAQPARLQFLTLETGAAWVGSYLVNLDADQKARVEGKAQVAVGGLALDNTRVFALAGSPDLPRNIKFDLAAGYGSLVAYLSGNQAQYRQFRTGPVDPYTELFALNRQNQPQYAYPYGGFGGGMGGGGGGGLDVDGNVGYVRPDAETDLNNLPERAQVNRVESLFSYPMGELKMDPGDRLSRILFAQNTSYLRLLKWDATPGNMVVHDVLRLTNNSKVPWTGGKAFILRDNTPLAQVEMPFTPVNENADLRMAQAHDVVVARDDRQIRNDEHSAPNWPRLILRKAINEIKLTLTNTRDMPVRVEASTIISGEPVSSQGAAVTKLTQQTDQFNWKKAVTWVIDLAPGERREVIFTYSTVYSAGVRPG